MTHVPMTLSKPQEVGNNIVWLWLGYEHLVLNCCILLAPRQGAFPSLHVMQQRCNAAGRALLPKAASLSFFPTRLPLGQGISPARTASGGPQGRRYCRRTNFSGVNTFYRHLPTQPDPTRPDPSHLALPRLIIGGNDRPCPALRP